jgi:hypothetical protein
MGRIAQTFPERALSDKRAPPETSGASIAEPVARLDLIGVTR